MRGFFGTRPMAGVIDYAEFIGSASAIIQISDVMTTADTVYDDGGNNTLYRATGSYSGKALGMTGSNTMEYYSDEHRIRS